MEEPTTRKCSFCSRQVQQADSISHYDEDGISATICRACVAVSCKMFNFRNLKQDVMGAISGDTAADKVKILSPRQIYGELRKYVIGQDEYLKALSMFGHRHLTRIARLFDGASADNLPKKENMFVIGQSGAGKTLGASVLGRTLQIPFHIGDLTAVTMTGYVGGDVLDLLRCLVKTAGGKFEHGILVIDEVDKCRKRTSGKTNDLDINGEGVQETLLKIIEGAQIEVPVWADGKAGKKVEETITLDTSRISVIACGAFSGMDFSGDKRVERNIGFIARDNRNDREMGTDDVIRKLIDTGMLPEFINRFQKYVVLNELGVDELKSIMYSPADSLIRRETERFANEGFRLMIDDSALGLVANKAYRLGLGARCLQTELSRILDYTAFDIFGTGQHGTVRVFADGDKLRAEVSLKKVRKHKAQRNPDASITTIA